MNVLIKPTFNRANKLHKQYKNHRICFRTTSKASNFVQISAPTSAPIPIVYKDTRSVASSSFEAPSLKYSYTDFIKDVKHNTIEKVSITQNTHIVNLETKNGVPHTIFLPTSTDIVPLLVDHNIDVVIIPDNQQFDKLEKYALDLAPQLVFLIILFTLMSRNMNSIMRHNTMKDTSMNTDIETTFADIAGANSAKAELMEIVDFLKDNTKYTRVGARIPKGVLLSGSPGVGKTLLAKAVAGEAQVPFFSCSASEFIESFVGVGASRLRDLFKKARENAPSIIFIDEIDTIGKKRDSSMLGPANDERDQTINQLLTLMDGFVENTGVIVIAATNRAEILDDALLRPGRFDRRITINLPDRAGREAILKVHTSNKPLHAGVNLVQLSKITVGFSGADLANLCNEAAIYAARANMEEICQYHFEFALDKITIGEEKESTIPLSKRHIISYHEAGHALVALLLSDYDIVRKVSIVPRGAAGGVTYFEPLDDNIDFGLVTRDYLETKIMVALGGRAAEEVIFGKSKLTTGASGDLIEVQKISRSMVTMYGFNENIGIANWEHVGAHSELAINDEVSRLVARLYEDTLVLLRKNIFTLHALSDKLLEKETLVYEELTSIVTYSVL